MLENEVIKINGKIIQEYTSEMIKGSHKDGHTALDRSEIFKIYFRATMKDAVVRQPDKPVAQVYQEEQSKIVSQMNSMDLVVEVMPQLQDIQSGLTKHKRKLAPVIPENIEQIKIVDEWSTCLDGSRFLEYHQKKSDDPSKPIMIIFTSDQCLKILSKSEKWQSDGTFQVVPKPKGFYQLYIIHGYYKFHLLPCVYALLSGKEENHYKSLILKLKEASLNASLELKPVYLMIDITIERYLL